MAAGTVPRPRPVSGHDDETVEELRARMGKKSKLAHRSRTSLTQTQQDQAQEDAFGDDPTWRKDPAADKLKAAHIAAHKENIRRDRAAQARADRDAAAQAKTDAAAAEAASFRGRTRRVGQVAGTVRDATGGGSLRVDDASGFVLGLLTWSWVILPFLNGGAAGVRDMLRAKFFNKAPDGSDLP